MTIKLSLMKHNDSLIIYESPSSEFSSYDYIYFFSFADVYSTLEPNGRVGDGKGPVVERDTLQVISPLNVLAV